MPDLVSIIIPTWNRKDEMRLCLEKIFIQDYKDLEIIVVDDGSTDETSVMIRRNFPKVKLIKNSKNVGSSQAKNQGIINGRGNYILFLDSDTEMVYIDTISTMVRILEENRQIGELGGELFIDRDRETKRIYGFNLSCMNLHSTPVYLETKGDDKRIIMMECDYVATSNCMIRRELVEEAGGFDPYYRYMGEDKELGYKIKKMGYKNMVDFRVGALHAYSKKNRAGLFSYDYHRTRTRFFIKQSSLKYILILPIIEFCFLLVHIRKTLKKNMGRSNDIQSGQIKISKGFVWLLGLFLAYTWNLIFLPQTISFRLRKADFLKK